MRLGKTRKELLASLDSDELTDWMAFFRLQASPPAPPPADVEEQLMKAFGHRRG